MTTRCNSRTGAGEGPAQTGDDNTQARGGDKADSSTVRPQGRRGTSGSVSVP